MSKHENTEIKKTKRKLTDLSVEELCGFVQELCAINKDNRLFADMFLGNDAEQCFKATQKKIEKALSYNWNRRGETTKIWNFKEVSLWLKAYRMFRKDLAELAELYIYAAETGNQITLDMGDIDERYYESMENLFETACAAVNDIPSGESRSEYIDKLKSIAQSTDGIGWGYHDSMEDIFFEAFDENEK